MVVVGFYVVVVVVVVVVDVVEVIVVVAVVAVVAVTAKVLLILLILFMTKCISFKRFLSMSKQLYYIIINNIYFKCSVSEEISYFVKLWNTKTRR